MTTLPIEWDVMTTTDDTSVLSGLELIMSDAKQRAARGDSLIPDVPEQLTVEASGMVEQVVKSGTPAPAIRRERRKSASGK